jgi:glycosyltransferase involved in cell wall biosynthesis
MRDPFFTVFTPVYNRSNMLHRVWDSLCAQTDRDFEWIVVDDGSTDGVGPLLADYQARADFPMVVLTQENRGKHVAWNRAVDRAKGTLFVPADSDDAFVPQTLERFRAFWTAIPIDRRSCFSGVNVLCCGEDGTVVGDRFPMDLLVSDNRELFYEYRVRGEKWGCLRTDLLRQRKFPELKGSYFPEGWVFFWLAQRYRVLCVNEVLRIYHQDAGNSLMLTIETKKRINPEIAYIRGAWQLDTNIRYLLRHESVARIIRGYTGLWRTGLQSGRNPFALIATRGSTLSKVMMMLVMPLGILLFLFSKTRKVVVS